MFKRITSAVALSALLAFSCTENEGGSPSSRRAPLVSNGKKAETKLPDALRVALLKARQAESDASYAIHKDGASHFFSENRTSNLSAQFLDNSVVVSQGNSLSARKFELELRSFGREGGVSAVGEASSPIIGASDNRVDYAHPEGITEWYLNGPAGLEQGFTVATKPSGDGKLVLEVGIQAPGIVLADKGDTLEFRTSAGVSVGAYRDLFAEDATGKLLPSALDVVGGKARLTVDDSEATYPIVVDPILSVVEAKLLAVTENGGPSLDLATKKFGGTIAVDADTAVLGAPDASAAYVFVRNGSSWSFQQKLVAPDTSNDIDFAASVAISGDTLVIGASTNAGGAYVFVRSGFTWSFQKKLLGALTDGTPELGTTGYAGSVAISGDTVVVGSSQIDSMAGAAYVFVRESGNWTIQKKLVASLTNGTLERAAGDLFGASVAVAGETVIVGSYGDNEASITSGSAYVFVRSGTSWTVQQKLVPLFPGGTSDAGAGDEFGRLVAISGETVVVGSSAKKKAAYAYVRSSGAWTIQEKFTPKLSDGSPDSSSGDAFGTSLALSGDVAIFGSKNASSAGVQTGVGYVFERTGTSWANPQRISAKLPSGANDSAEGDEFATAVAISGDTAIWGAPSKDSTSPTIVDAGAAYFYEKAGAAWSPAQKQMASFSPGTYEGSSFDYFGATVALDGNTAAVSLSRTCAVYFFLRTGATWNLQQKISAKTSFPSGAKVTGCSYSLALSGDTALVGSNIEGSTFATQNSGAVFVLVRNGATWSFQQKLTAAYDGLSDVGMGDYFGFAVALEGNTAVVGSPMDDANYGDEGSAYVFVRNGTTWSAQAKLRSKSAQAVLDESESDHFGTLVAISGETVIVGAPDHDATYSTTDVGAAYVYVRSGTSWTFEAKLGAALPGGASDEVSASLFSGALAFEGDRALFGRVGPQPSGNSGAVYVYARSGTTWSVEQKLSPELPGGGADGAASDYFGSKIGLSGAVAVISSPGDDDGAADAGSIYVYQRRGGTWTSVDKMTAELSNGTPEVAASDFFGRALSISGDTFIAGRPTAIVDGLTGAGAAYVYRLSAFSCDTASDCPENAVCDAEVCVAEKPGGGTCSAGAECITGTCTDGKCVGSLGDPCSAASDCSSNFCADGVCCSTACDAGPCQACNYPGKAGTCVLTGGGELPPSGRSCQAADAECGEGRCDGASAATCAFLAGTVCPASCETGGSVRGEGACDVSGQCAGGSVSSCGAYACESGECRTSCDETGGCGDGYVCESNSCGASGTGGGSGSGGSSGSGGTGGGDTGGSGGTSAGGSGGASTGGGATGGSGSAETGGTGGLSSGGTSGGETGGADTGGSGSETGGSETGGTLGNAGEGGGDGGSTAGQSGGCSAAGGAPRDSSTWGILGTLTLVLIARRKGLRRAA